MPIDESRVSELVGEIEQFIEAERVKDVDEEDSDKEDAERDNTRPDRDGLSKKMLCFLENLKSLASLVRKAEAEAAPGLEELIGCADRVFSEAVDLAYGGENEYNETSVEFLPSFAHVEGALVEETYDSEFPSLSRIAPLLTQFLSFMNPQSYERLRAQVKLPKPWKKTIRPHELSTQCARFQDVIPEWIENNTNTSATAVVQARCEISSDDINNPVDAIFAPASSPGATSILAISSMGGWKDRTSFVHYYFPSLTDDVSSSDSFMHSHHITADLCSAMADMIIDPLRNLMWVADHDRVKSYMWTGEKGGKEKARRVHTLDSDLYNGPLAVMGVSGGSVGPGDGAKFIRAGTKGVVAFWDLDFLPTHGDKGKRIIGKKMDPEYLDTWRDDPENIELSTGSPVASIVTLEYANKAGEDTGFVVGKWHPHPNPGNSSVMLCGSSQKMEKYHCYAYDFAAGTEGKIAARYLGHGGTVNGFSTSYTPAGAAAGANGDPNVFLTWCSDGHARLYDVRTSLPTMTIRPTCELESMPAAVLVHPGGIPFIFTGGDKSESIKLWDVRSKQVIYELATGNNSVAALAWDSANTTLYAATTCNYVDRLGNYHGYRYAKIPVVKSTADVQAEQNAAAEDDDDDDEPELDEDGDEIEEEDDEFCWPTQAYRHEKYYGHIFDAGEHRIYKYAFKSNPDKDVLPAYGNGRVENENDYW